MRRQTPRFATGSALVGRDAELATIREVAESARNGSGATVCVVGPPGIGKSALVRVAATTSDSAISVVGRCAPPPSTPLRALSELAVAAVGAGGDLGAVDDTIFGAALRTLLGQRSGPDDAGHGALLIGEGLRLLMDSVPGPLTVGIVEDLHWADDETLAVLDYVVDHLESSGLLLMVTLRAYESTEADNVVGGWADRGVSTALTLDPLQSSDVVAMVNGLGGGDVDQEFLAAVIRSSDGNPLLVEEFVRDVGTVSGGSIPSLPMPTTFSQAVRRRIDALEPSQRERIQLAALVSRNLDGEVLAKLGVADPSGLVADAVRVQLAAPGAGDEPARFRHDLTRDAVVLTLSAHDRRRIAMSALQHLETFELGDRDLEAASQLAAASGDRRRASAMLIEAAHRAVAMGATATALSRLDAASELADADALHGPIIREYRLEALALAGRAREAIVIGERLIPELAERHDTARLDRVQLALARASGSLGAWSDAAQRLDEAQPEATVAPVEMAAYRAICEIELGRVGEARRLAERVLARDDLMPVAECEAREVLGRVDRETSYLGAAEHFRAGVDAASRGGLDLWRARSLLELGLCEATVYGRSATFEAASTSARQCGAMALSAMCDYNLANLYGIHLRGHDAVRVSERAIATAELLQSPKLEALGWVTTGQGHAVLGARASARLAGDRARAAAPDDREIDGLAAGMCEGLGDLIRGDLEAAGHHFAHSLDVLGSIPVPTATSPWYLGSLVLAVADHPGASRVRDQLATASFRAAPTLEALAHLMDATAAGRTDGPDAAERHLELVHASRDRFAEMSATVAGTWHLLWAVAATAAIADGWGTPLEDLDRAERWFRDRGLDSTARWCTALLREAGVGPRRRGKAASEVPAALHGYGLTNREYEVLVELGQRLTNREIAERLVISPSTVKTHVERLLAKTGSANRIALAELAAAVDAE